MERWGNRNSGWISGFNKDMRGLCEFSKTFKTAFMKTEIKNDIPKIQAYLAFPVHKIMGSMITKNHSCPSSEIKIIRRSNDPIRGIEFNIS